MVHNQTATILRRAPINVMSLTTATTPTTAIMMIMMIMMMSTLGAVTATSDETKDNSAIGGATTTTTTTAQDCVVTDEGACLYDDIHHLSNNREEKGDNHDNEDKEEKEENEEEGNDEFIWDPDKEFAYHDDMSILDVLNPELLQNVTLWQDIAERLRNHELVIIRDAFVPEFADYVWEELYRDDLEWPHWDAWQEDGFTYSHHNFYDVDVSILNQVFFGIDLASDSHVRPVFFSLSLSSFFHSHVFP